MIGYSVVQHVSSGAVRFAPAPNRTVPTREDVAIPVVPRPISGARIEADDTETIADRLDAIRTALAQVTWYLFNAEGWR